MKKINLINGLWDDSHEKQSPQKFGRYAVMLLMLLTLGVGQMWAKTVYIDISSFTDYNSQIYVHYWGGGEAYKAASSAGTNLYKVDNVPDGASWQVLRSNGGSGDGDRYNYQNNCSSSDNIYHVTGWNNSGSSEQLDILPKQKYIYFDVSGSNADRWRAADFNTKFNWYSVNSVFSSATWCKSKLSDGVYYTQVPNTDHLGQVQLCRMNPSNDGDEWNSSGTAKADNDYNCLYVKSENKDWWNTWIPGWTTYAPPLSAVSLSDNGTAILAGGGTELNPYLIATGATIKVVANGTKAVADPDATIWYNIKDNTTSKQNSSTATYSFPASATANTVYQMKVDGYTKVSSTSSSTLTSDIIYYKTVSVKNISVYIYVGGCSAAEINSLVLTGTPYVGSVALDGVTKYIGDFTTDGNWRKYTFTNVSEVRSLVVARSGGRAVDNITATADVYAKYDGTTLDGKCIPRVNPTWGTAPANGAAGGSMTASVSGAPGDATISWSSTATSYATVNSSGVISYVAAGSATIKANVSWSASGDYCAGSYELSQAITVTSGATVSATRTCPAYVAAGVAGQVTLDISSTGATTGWYYRIYNGSGYEGPDNVNASSNSASWTMTGGVPADARTYTVELYDGSNVKQATSSGVTITGETAYSTTVSSGSNGSVSPSGAIYANNSNIHPSITATANTNYHFVDWTSNNAAASVASTTSATTTVTATAGGYTITANFAGDQYTITYYDQGGSAFSGTQSEAPATHTYGTATDLKIPTKDGYTFGGWFTASDCASGAVGNTTSASLGATAYTANISLYAKWTERTVTVSPICAYDAGDPSYSNPTASNSGTVGITSTSQLVAPVAGTGYTFAGWTLSNNLVVTSGNKNTDRTITVRTNGDGEDVTAIAKYNEVLTSTFYISGATSARSPFTGWGASGISMQKKTGYSTIEKYYCTISVDNIAGDGEFEFKPYNSSGNVHYGHDNYWVTRENHADITCWGDNGYSLWFKPDIAGDYEFEIDMTGTYPVLSVTFPISYTLTYSIGSVAGTDGSISTSPTTSSGSLVISGNSVTLTGPEAKTGYHWKGWYTNPGGTTGHIEDENQAISVTMNADKTLYACYEENTYNVSASASPAAGGTVSPTVATSMGQVTGGSINASANPGYSFTSWSIATGSGSFTSALTTASNTFKPTAASTLTGTFSEVMRTVSVDVNNEYLGSVSTTSLTSVGPETKSAAVTATPATGATFTRWDVESGVNIASGYTSTSNPVKVNATAASKKLTAVFTETTYAVTLSTADASKGTVGSSTSAGQITAVEINATPKPGYMFSKWVKTGSGTVTYYTGAGNGQLTDASGEEKETTYICVTGGSVTLQATWELDRSSGYVVYYGNDGKNADGGTDASQTRAWKDGKLYRPTTEESNTSSFTFTAGVGDVDKVIEFKIHKLADNSWYGYNSAEGGKITGSITNATLNTSYGNGRICITMPGSYIFTWNKSNNQLSISYPTDVYYVRGGFDSWRWSYPMTETSSGIYEATVNMTEANHTYSGNNGVTLLIGGQYYGKNTTTITRESNVANSCVVGQSNIGLTTDFTGNYTFTFNSSTNQLTVTYPTAYKLNYAIGTVNGTSGTISTSPSTATGSWVLKDDVVTLTGPAAKEGYTWSGWYTNAGGSEGNIPDVSRAIDVTMDATKTLYACYTINNHSITHSAATNGSYTIKVGSLDPVSTNTTADYAQTITLAATPAIGYHFTTWSVAKSISGTVTPTPNATTTPATFSMPDDDVTVSATFAANNYTITLNNHGATTAGTTSVSVTYNATTGLTSDITVPEKDGYTFGGFYTEEGGSGSQLISDAGKWQKSNAWINAGGNWVNAGDVTLHAKWTAINYTVTFDAETNSGTCDTDVKEVTFGSAYGELPTAVHTGDDAFLGWYTTPSGEGSLVTEETLVSIADDHTLYARFETTFEVVVQFKCGSDVLYPGTKVNASASTVSPTITAPEILGYEFSGWTETGGSYVTYADAGAASTTIHATGAATVVANYTVVPTVYFKNNLEWENVYVTFDTYFDDSKQNAPGNNGKPYYKMTKLGSTDIYYCTIPDAYITNNYASWAYNIAFDNSGFNYSVAEADPNHHGNYQAFNGGEFTGRGDFDPKATMFIPYNGDTETRNGGTFFKTGCWMKYNSTESGYKIYANTYQSGSGGSAVTGTPIMLTSDVAGGFEFKAKVYLGSTDYTYGFMLHKEYQKNDHDLWYTNTATINAGTDDLPWHFYTNGASENGMRCGLHTEATGDYEFIVSFGTGRPMVNVVYPVSVGDYRLVYKDNATWSNGAHNASWNHPSRVIKAKANAEDIVSFYVASGATPSILLQKCTSIDGSGNPVWNAGTSVTVCATDTGVYNYKVVQDADKNATVTYVGAYSGNFYIRTDVSDGGWSNYKTSGTNVMTYSEYTEIEHDYTHYYMRFVNQGKNVKFCIANDYSECVSDTLVSDGYTNEWIEAYANVRFMWDKRTNRVSRAYISGSSIVSDRFLVLEGDDKLFNESGQALTTAGGGKVSGLNDYEMKFTDDQNWIYEATVKAQPGARIKLTAKYNNKIQYFYGAEGARTDETTELLLGGSDAYQYKVRVVYDFKTNRLIKAFIPDGDITTDLPIEADLMIIRDHQADAQQITFNGGSLSEVQIVYGAMKFNKYTVNNKNRTAPHGNAGLSKYSRDLFYISFPFDVKLSEVFGFGTYGKHWILEYYDGKGRAKNGFWQDSDPNWKFVMPAQRHDFTMKAFEGYILALDLDEMTETSSVWNNGVEDVYVYFPSTDSLKNIQATNRLIKIDQEGYECKIGPRFEGGDDRRVKDSYWHCIGVPSFANYNRDLYVTNGGTQIDWSDDDGVIDWSTPSLPYLYTVNWNDKSLSVTNSATFSFKATWSYLVQYAGTSIYWSQVNVTPSAVVARERTAPTNAEFRIELKQAGEKADQTFVRLTDEENVTTGFDFNYDLSKEFNKNKANIYTMVSTMIDGDLSLTQTAGNCLPMSEQTTVVPVGVKIASNGDYTFAIPEGTNGVGVTLIDNETGVRTPLSALDYTINLNAGTYDSRFVLEISPIQHTPTGIESTEHRTQNTDVRKVLIDGLLYIVKDGKVFDARGSRVQ